MGGEILKINEYGKGNEEVLLMFPPLVCRSDVYGFVRPELEKRFHILVVSYPGIDDGINTEFSSVEQVIDDTEEKARGKYLPMQIDRAGKA